MTDGEKQALRNSMADKKISEMTAEERELFDQAFQYGFKDKAQIQPTDRKSELPSCLSCLSFLRPNMTQMIGMTGVSFTDLIFLQIRILIQAFSKVA